MEVTLALLADAANVSREGKLNILGELNIIFSRSLPATHPTMVLVMRFQAAPSEYGQERELEVHLVDPDGQSKGQIKGKFTVPQPPPGEFPAMVNILPIHNSRVEREGPHAFDIMINGDVKKSVPFEVKLLPQGGQ